jgi:hypothetical protein
MDRVEYEKLIIQELINASKNNELNICPWYQRREVWSQSQKAYLINSIFEQKPVPSLYIRHSINIDTDRSIKEIVDGQQRIRAILEYVQGKFSAKHPNYGKKVAYQELKRAEAEKFRLTSLSVGYLLGATDGDVIEIFGRLNSVAKTLNPQEKRNARFSGEFKQFCLKEASTRLPIWRDLNIFTANDIARMNEFAFVSDLALNLLKGLSDFSQAKIDGIYEEFDDVFPAQADLTRRFEKVFSLIANLDREAIRDTIFSRQPVFFSLFVVLDSCKKKLSSSGLEKALFEIDTIFNSEGGQAPLKEVELEFINACKASTQRIKSRKVRDAFIRKFVL